LFQHARLSRPNPEFGYCLDDNARALTAAIRAHALTRDNGLLDYIRHYLAFVERCQLPDGRFHNFMAADGTWLDDAGSGDSQGRAIQALGFAAHKSPQSEVRLRALSCLDKTLRWLPKLEGLRPRAFALMGLHAWRQAEPSLPLMRLAETFARGLAEAYEACAGPDWRWFEDQLTYCNASLPQVLLDTHWPAVALDSLAWLCDELLAGGQLEVVGNRGWYPRGGPRARFDQQAVDAEAMVSACTAAFQVSGDARFRTWAEQSFAWFLGGNAGGQPMVDAETGGCYDGLEDGGVNRNQGAESLLAWLSAHMAMLEAGWI
jgi:hypothetical protein